MFSSSFYPKSSSTLKDQGSIATNQRCFLAFKGQNGHLSYTRAVVPMPSPMLAPQCHPPVLLTSPSRHSATNPLWARAAARASVFFLHTWHHSVTHRAITHTAARASVPRQRRLAFNLAIGENKYIYIYISTEPLQRIQRGRIA